MKRLSHRDRLQLMKFVCSFAWADFEVQDAEREYVHKLVKRLHLEPEEAKQVEGWLKLPPRPEDVDPNSVPLAHKQLFLDTMKGIVEADGKVTVEERENLHLFQALLK
jgi:uncharacterized tellurite resistance protein B-like protein